MHLAEYIRSQFILSYLAIIIFVTVPTSYVAPAVLYLEISKQRKTSLDYNRLSEEFLKNALLKKDTKAVREQLALVEVGQLADFLDSDTKRIAFWVNIYNAYIQVLLQEDPSRIGNKGKFFTKKQIPLFGKMISFDKIEHHILRRSQWKFGLGNFQLSFRPKFEKSLRVNEREPRIHFVLNCGARSCPPTKVLQPTTLEEQLRSSTTDFLIQTTTYKKEQNTVEITPLFFWFRGDFGNKKGIRQLLKDEGLISKDSKPALKKKEYDWTLDLDNWIDWREGTHDN